MKYSLFVFAILVASLAYGQSPKTSPAAADSPNAAASGSPSAPPTIASTIDRELTIVEKEVVEAALENYERGRREDWDPRAAGSP